jgi:hypothetical protein
MKIKVHQASTTLALSGHIFPESYIDRGDAGAKFASGVSDSGGNFVAGVIENGDQQ